jgi:hypothetical protein
VSGTFNATGLASMESDCLGLGGACSAGSRSVPAGATVSVRVTEGWGDPLDAYELRLDLP